MTMTCSTSAHTNTTPSTLAVLTEVSRMIFQKTSRFERAVAQNHLRFQQIYTHLQHSLYTVNLKPDSFAIYKQSVSLLFEIYQQALENRSLKPDLLAIHKWLVIIRRLMTQEIAGLYLRDFQTDPDAHNTFDLSLEYSFTGCLLRTISLLIPASCVDPAE